MNRTVRVPLTVTKRNVEQEMDLFTQNVKFNAEERQKAFNATMDDFNRRLEQMRAYLNDAIEQRKASITELNAIVEDEGRNLQEQVRVTLENIKTNHLHQHEKTQATISEIEKDIEALIQEDENRADAFYELFSAKITELRSAFLQSARLCVSTENIQLTRQAEFEKKTNENLTELQNQKNRQFTHLSRDVAVEKNSREESRAIRQRLAAEELSRMTQLVRRAIEDRTLDFDRLHSYLNESSHKLASIVLQHYGSMEAPAMDDDFD